jgi:hypothetical protein
LQLVLRQEATEVAKRVQKQTRLLILMTPRTEQENVSIKLGHHLLICLFPGFSGGSIQGLCILRFAQREETLDLPYLTLLCDNLKK